MKFKNIFMVLIFLFLLGSIASASASCSEDISAVSMDGSGLNDGAVIESIDDSSLYDGAVIESIDDSSLYDVKAIDTFNEDLDEE